MDAVKVAKALYDYVESLPGSRRQEYDEIHRVIPVTLSLAESVARGWCVLTDEGECLLEDGWAYLNQGWTSGEGAHAVTVPPAGLVD